MLTMGQTVDQPDVASQEDNPLAAAEQAVDKGDFLTAIRLYEELVQPGADMLGGIIHNLVPLYLKARRPALALRAAEALTFFAPKSVDAWMALAQMRERFADWEGALQALYQVLDLAPEHEGAHQSRLFILSAHAPQRDVRALHEDWFGSLKGTRPPLVDPDPRRPLRIGYISGDFRRHVMDRVILPLLQYRDRRAFEVFCYDTVAKRDATTDQMEGLADHWWDISKLDDLESWELIRRDGIDVLVDLSGLTFGQRLRLMARRPAPIQVTTTGYLPTTGTHCFDWKICDTTAGSQDEYTEPLWQLPNALCPTPLPGAPGITPSPYGRNGYITFGCVNSYSKVTREAIDAWTLILQRVPTARLVMVVAGCQEHEMAISVLRRFGPVQDRVLLTEWQTGHRFPVVFADIDIALNTHPYGGCMTSFDTLWQGAPIVCLEGDRTIGRYAAHYMHALGLHDFVAQDWEDYVDAAVSAAEAPSELKHIRYTMRDKITAHPMFNVQHWVQHMEDAYRAMWVSRCVHTRVSALARSRAKHGPSPAQFAAEGRPS